MGFFEFIRSTRSLLTSYDITAECVVVNDSVRERALAGFVAKGTHLNLAICNTADCPASECP